MRIYEFTTPSVDEGWKSNIAAAGLGAAMALTPSNKTEQPKPHSHSITAAVKTPLSRVDTLKHAAMDAGIKGAELTHLLSQAAHETLDFSRMGETGSPTYLTKHYDITQNPHKAKILGNIDKGDGIKYKGRGFLMHTGRYNYHMIGKALGLPLEEHPELLEKPDVAAKAAIWFWTKKVQPKITNFNNVSNVTKRINPGMKGLKSRKDRFAQYKDNTPD